MTTTDYRDGAFELRHSAIRSSFDSRHSSAFPRATAYRGHSTQPTNHPSWMAMGMVRPRQELESSQKIPK